MTGKNVHINGFEPRVIPKTLETDQEQRGTGDPCGQQFAADAPPGFEHIVVAMLLLLILHAQVLLPRFLNTYIP